MLRPAELPSHLEIESPALRLSWDVGVAAAYRPGLEEDWEDDVYSCAPESRLRLYAMLWEQLQPLAFEERADVLDVLAGWAAHAPQVRETHRVMTANELRQLSDDGLVEIGAHTMTHPLLTQLPRPAQLDEMSASRSRLGSILGRDVTSFSYPFGAHDGESVAAGQAAGFGCACTTVEASVHRWSDPLRFGRFDVRNWNGKQLEAELRSWLRR